MPGMSEKKKTSGKEVIVTGEEREKGGTSGIIGSASSPGGHKPLRGPELLL